MLTVAVPNLGTYSPATGIGRVAVELARCWRQEVEFIHTRFRSVNLPVLRNFPRGVDIPDGTDLVLLPQLTGAQALRTRRAVPAVVIVHDIGIVDFPPDRREMNSLTYQSVAGSVYALPCADHVIAVSNFTRQRLLHHLPSLPAEHVSVISSGVSESFIHCDLPRAVARRRIERLIGSAVGSPLLLYVGTEHPRKNVALLLEVVRALQHDWPRLQLLKVGTAGNPRWRAATERAMERLGLQAGHDVHFVEEISDDSLAAAYRTADVVVSASLYEGFGLPALEAMAVGTPVVVTNQAALPEVVGSTGWTASPDRDPLVAAVSSALQAAPDDPRLAAARRRARGLTWDRAARCYLDVLRGLRSCRGPRGAQ